MKNLKHITTLLTATTALLLFTACNNGNSKTENTSNKTNNVETKAKTPKGSDIYLKQKGDYTWLYASNGQCKFTPAQIAEALKYTEDKIKKEKSSSPKFCNYSITHSDNTTSRYYITMLEAPIKTIKKSINRNLKKNNVNNFTISQSGDTYIFRHVNQRFLLLYNPNYANAVKISYGSYIIMRDLDKAQKAERQENGYKIANYLIDTYRD